MSIRDQKEFEVIYDRCSPLAYGLAFKILKNETEAQDVLQQAFLSLWQHAEEFDPAKGQVSTWLYTFVRNRCIDVLRRKRSENRVSLDGENPIMDLLFEDDSIDAIANRGMIKGALDSLPDEQRTVIEAAYFEGMTQQEISNRSGEPLGTIKTRMRLGMLKLAESLKKEAQIS